MNKKHYTEFDDNGKITYIIKRNDDKIPFNHNNFIEGEYSPEKYKVDIINKNIIEKSETELLNNLIKTADNENRILRNNLLTESDKFMTEDYPSNKKAEWKQYRQALRDITQQEGWPLNPIWPTAPE